MKALGIKWGSPEVASPSPDNDELHYPDLYIESDEELSIPEKGTATIKFTRTRVSEETRKGQPSRYCYTLSVEAIGDISKSKPKKEREDTASVVDKLLVAVMKDSDGGENEY